VKHPRIAEHAWRRAKSCNAGNCVEVAAIDDGVAIRDSKNPNGEILRYSSSEWTSFLEAAKAGEFDHLT
jgi:hypothetical protein